jgi:ATP-binding cassette, subfamily B, bacterial MsbA
MKTEENKPIQNPLRAMDQFRRLFAYVKPYRRRLFVALIAIAIGSVLSLAGPYTLQFLIDAVFSHNDSALLNRITLILIGIFATQTVFYFIRGYLLAFIGERVMADLRMKLFEHLQSLSLNFYNERRTGELVSRLTNDVTTVRALVTSDIATALAQLLTFVGAFILIIVTNWRLTLFMLALVPLVTILAIMYGRRLRKLSRAVQDKLADATHVIEESISGVRVVQSFGRQPYEIGRYRTSIENTFRLAMQRIKLSASFGPLISFLGFSVVVSIFWFGGMQVLAGELTAGQLAMFLVLTFTIAGSIGQFSGLWAHLQEAMGATSRLFELFDTQPEIADLPGAISLSQVEGRITFDGVTFAYQSNPDSPTLHGIDLEIEPGQTLALVGPSGAGKTTLVNLIPRFYDPCSGSVRLDGHDIKNIKVDSLRSQLAIVPQETLLFGGSVRENILYGRLDATDEELVDAAKAANADDFIRQLAQGYETLVGERGVKLSVGQRQRIAIARALLKDPRILLLDEATSSLDSESESLVQEALQRLMYGRTSLVIAHRLSTIQNADKIAVLDGGRLVEYGSHAELLTLDGLYARLHRIQFKLDGDRLGSPQPAEAIEPEAATKERRRSFGFFPGLGSHE